MPDVTPDFLPDRRIELAQEIAAATDAGELARFRNVEVIGIVSEHLIDIAPEYPVIMGLVVFAAIDILFQDFPHLDEQMVGVFLHEELLRMLVEALN